MAGAGYKLFNTGDVLTAAQVNTYLNEQTVMVFADSAARTTALSGVLSEGMMSYLQDTDSVEVYDGSAWTAVGGGGSSPLTTKGDLYTFSTVDARLAAGNNGETLVADDSTSTGLRYNQSATSLANPVINGGLDIWQRGTSFAGSSTAFCADRWAAYRTVAGSTFSRQTTSDTTNLPNIQYCVRVQRDSGNASAGTIILAQGFETTNSIPFAGKTVTLSFYARKGADMTANLGVQFGSGTGTDQNWGSFTGLSYITNTTQALTTTWTRYVFTGTVATTATELMMQFYYVPTGTASTDDYFEITGVQINVGTWTASTAPTFRRSGGTIAGELAACKRYYVKTKTSNHTMTGNAFTTSTAAAYMKFEAEMRSSPTITIPAAGSSTGQMAFLTSSGGYPATIGTNTAGSITTFGFQIECTGYTSAFTAGNATALYITGTNQTFYEASAEL